MREGVWPRAVLFDLDGTLADSFRGLHGALAQALEELGLPARDLAWVRRHVGRGARALLEDALGSAPRELLEPLGKRFGELYEATYLETTPPRPGAGELLALAYANTAGRVAVVSNKLGFLCRAWLDHVGLGRWVPLVVGPETYGVTKPDPAAVRPVLAALAAQPKEALLVGDMPIDARTAANVGMPCLLVAGGAAEEEELAQAGALAVLPDLLQVAHWLVEAGGGWQYHTREVRERGGAWDD